MLLHIACRAEEEDILGAWNILKVNHADLEEPAAMVLPRTPSESPAASGNELESVFSGSHLPELFFMEMLSSYAVRAVIDLSPGQGEFGKACLSSRVPYTAICLTEAHAKHLETLLTDFVVRKMYEEGHTLYRAKAAAALANTQGDEGTDDNSSDSDAPKKKKKDTTKTSGEDKEKEKKTETRKDDEDNTKKEDKKKKQQKDKDNKGKEKGDKDKKKVKGKKRSGDECEEDSEDEKPKRKKKTTDTGKKRKVCSVSDTDEDRSESLPW